jgi:signal transduction histidine kinase
MGMVKIPDGLVADDPVDPTADDELRMLGRITAGVAHDLNNYLCVTNLLLALLETAPDNRELLARTRASIDQARRLALSLVGYVRGESPAFEPVDFGALVARTLGLVTRGLPLAITVHTEIAAELPAVRGIVPELEQLILNLVLNATDAMPDGGELTVRVQPAGTAMLYLELSDTGTGMVAESLVTLHGRTASSKAGRRVGLGLGIIRRVIEHHGGSIRFTRQPTGRGTIVRALLPTG